MAPLFGGAPPEKAALWIAISFLPLFLHCVCFLIGPHGITGESAPVGTFDFFAKFLSSVDCFLEQGNKRLTLSNEPLFKKKILERSTERHAVSAIGCGATQISFYCGFLRGPIVARGEG